MEKRQPSARADRAACLAPKPVTDLNVANGAFPSPFPSISESLALCSTPHDPAFLFLGGP